MALGKGEFYSSTNGVGLHIADTKIFFSLLKITTSPFKNLKFNS
jgi:hypothetical protein